MCGAALYQTGLTIGHFAKENTMVVDRRQADETPLRDEVRDKPEALDTLALPFPTCLMRTNACGIATYRNPATNSGPPTLRLSFLTVKGRQRLAQVV
jgi:hypothetical protein